MFQHPWFLLLLVIVPLLGWLDSRGRRRSTIAFSSAAMEWNMSPTWRQRFAWLPTACVMLAASLMILSLARPRIGRERTMVSTEGIAIAMVVDRSGSMQALDFQIDNTHVDRLTAVKNVASTFVLGDQESDGGELMGRPSDLIGLIVFAGYADAITPLTLDHRFLVDQLKRTSIALQRDEDGTAIGDAISLAVDKLSTLQHDKTREIKSKVIILLTDGENTAGEIEPVQAAELAAAMGIKVYTIGVGTKGQAPFPVRRTASGQLLVQYEFVNIDEDTLQSIAQATGGKYFRATDTDSLKSIYQEIDQLETTRVETHQFFDYQELAIHAARADGILLPPLLLAALCLLAIRIALRETVFRYLGE